MKISLPFAGWGSETLVSEGILAVKNRYLQRFKAAGTTPGIFERFSLGLRAETADALNMSPDVAKNFVNNDMAGALAAALQPLFDAFMGKNLNTRDRALILTRLIGSPIKPPDPLNPPRKTTHPTNRPILRFKRS